MLRLCCEMPGVLKYQHVPYPEIPSGHALIRIRRVGICGTDLHAYDGTQPYFDYPRVLGHELAGEVVDFNGEPNDGLARNQKVCIIPYFHCGICIACRSGKTNCCSRLNVAGVHVDGGMAEYYCVPMQFVISDSTLDLDMLAVVEPFAIGAHAIFRAKIELSELVLVIGLGPIGLAVLQSAVNEGAKVIGMDVNPYRLQMARQLVPDSKILDGRNQYLNSELHDITSGEMFSVVFDATGNQQAINNGINYLSHGGRYVLVGLQKKDLVFSHPELHKREATLMSSRNATRADFQNVITAFKIGIVNLSSYITNKIPFPELAERFPEISDPYNGIIKAIVEI